MSITKLNNLSISAVTALPSGVGGKVLQVVQTVKTDTFASSSSETPIDVTGLSVSITPSSSNNKILVLINISGGGVGGVNPGQFRLLRGSTLIYAGDAAGSRERGYGSFISVDQYTTGTSSGMFLDSPSTTSSTTYKVTVTSNNTVYINRTSHDQDTVLRQRGASTITAMEIAV